MAYFMKAPGFTPDNPGKSVKQLYSWVYQLNENLKYMFSHLDEENLSESFASSLVSGTSAAVAELEKTVKKLNEEIFGSTEWHTLTLVNASAFSADFVPMVMRVGNLVQMTGALTLKKALASGVSMTVSTLPEEFRPLVHYAFNVPCSIKSIRLDIYPSGVVELKNNSGADIATGKLVSVALTYAI